MMDKQRYIYILYKFNNDVKFKRIIKLMMSTEDDDEDWSMGMRIMVILFCVSLLLLFSIALSSVDSLLCCDASDVLLIMAGLFFCASMSEEKKQNSFIIKYETILNGKHSRDSH